jgi:hypothetical protein
MSEVNQEKTKKQKRKKFDYATFYQENKKFDLETYEKSGKPRIFIEIILVTLFVVYFAYGALMLYWAGGPIREWYNNTASEEILNMIDVAVDAGMEYSVESILIFVGVYIITLWVSYVVVKFFSKLAAWFLYGSFVIQIGIFLVLFFNFESSYKYLFLVPVVIQLLILIFWRKKLQRAVEYVKIGGLAIWKERHLLIPQFIQTIWIFLLSFFHVIVTFTTFMDYNEYDSINIGPVEITDGWIYAGYSLLFVFLILIVMYTTLGMKQLMIHHWFRGEHLSYSLSYKMIRRRWRAMMGYALFSSIIHSIQFIYKLFKGEIKVTNIKDAFNVTQELTPVNPMSLDAEEGKKTQLKIGATGKLKKEKKRLALHERIWMGLNYFTLPAIALENKLFAPALWRSLKMVAKSIPDLYIKKAHVNKLFRVMQWISVFLNGVLGSMAGGLVGKYIFGYSGVQLYATVAVGFTLFEWIGGMTSVLVLNDLNMAYITLMYIYTIDDENKKEGYNRFELEKLEKIEAKLIAKEKKKKARKNKRAKVDSEPEEIINVPEPDKDNPGNEK